MAISGTDVRWTVADLEVLPDDGGRYEIIDGELFVTRAPHWKHQIYSTYGVLEYWIADREQRKVEVYRREGGVLKLALSLYAADELTSPVLPGFIVDVSQLF